MLGKETMKQIIFYLLALMAGMGGIGSIVSGHPFIGMGLFVIFFILLHEFDA
jgi:uncharacterized membrane protein YtjA (UPF0391 family)